MSSVEAFRDFINGRLSAAAAEIFTVFLQTIAQYHQEIQAQQRLLQISRREPTKSPATDDQHQQFYRDEQLWNTKANSSLSQEEPEPPQIKEVLLVVKQEANTILGTVFEDKSEQRENLDSENVLREYVNEEKIHAHQRLLDINLNPKIKLHKIDGPKQQMNFRLDQEEPQTPQIKHEQEEICTSQQEEQLELKQELDSFTMISTGEPSEPEPDGELLLCNDSVVAGGQNQTNIQHVGLESSVNMCTHSTEKSHSCGRCGKSFCSESILLAHMTTHTGEKPYSCEIRGKSYSQQGDLMCHKRTHTSEKLYSCGTCGKRFNKKSILLVHKRTHTDEKPYSCETCGKSYRQQSGLLYHKRTHSGEKPYSCTTCGKSFSVNQDLLVHMRSHTDERPYFCETCGKSYKNKYDLLAHKRIHTGEKPYSCETCGKRYHHSRGLGYHKKTHRDVKPYSCGTCGKSFIYMSHLLVHKTVHTDETPFCCEICGKSFRRHTGLSRHKRSHRPKNIFP